ncbi:MAG TPA: class I SAM-dependent methyltransferase [Solirubrobacteraceae bacterium]|nr:class I SAM-dependent methyltransferase [Solirubrobacteraceae bacterium]
MRLLARLPGGAVCAEIGTWRGDFARWILTSRHPKLLYLVDPWEYRSEGAYERARFGGRTNDGQAEMDAMHRAVVERFRKNIDRGQVEVRRARSLDAASTFAEDSLDWVYVDGDHTYDGVMADLEAYFRVVKPGGYLAGDDFGHAGWWEDGVTRAVNAFASHGELTIIGAQFLLRKPLQ